MRKIWFRSAFNIFISTLKMEKLFWKNQIFYYLYAHPFYINKFSNTIIFQHNSILVFQ